MKTRTYNPVALIIVDGWGLGGPGRGNALSCVPTPSMDWLRGTYPSTSLVAHGEAVGLQAGQMGDSNVGHLNIGAGRIVYQDLVRISNALAVDELEQKQAWRAALERARHNQGSLHLVGLLSDGGVHSHISHLKRLLLSCRAAGISPWVHAQLDGRDVSPTSGAGFLTDIAAFMETEGVGRLATVMGRYYGMDRDQRWERTELAYRAMTEGAGIVTDDAAAEVLAGYERGLTDEFVPPLVLHEYLSSPRLTGADEAVFFNFRSDRMRQIVRAFASAAQVGFERRQVVEANITTMTRYHRDFTFPVLFEPQNLKNTLGSVLSDAGLRQIRLAETEKYAHVTFFFNGGLDTPFPGEDRHLVPSPRVATYDLQPEMSAESVTDAFLSALNAGYDFIVMNYANLDMVGHTGVYSAACRAVETVDRELGRAVRAVLERGGAALITADHGNAEKMLDDNNEPYTAHTLNPVPLILATPNGQQRISGPGILADVAPTALELLGLGQPAEMTGRSLIMEEAK